MAISVHLIPVSMNAGQYQRATELIDDEGLATPAGSAGSQTGCTNGAYSTRKYTR